MPIETPRSALIDGSSPTGSSSPVTKMKVPQARTAIAAQAERSTFWSSAAGVASESVKRSTTV